MKVKINEFIFNLLTKIVFLFMNLKNEKKNNQTTVLLNFYNFGPFIKSSEIDDLLSSPKGLAELHTVKLIESFFNQPISSLKKDTLEKYAEITTQETHVIFTPGYKNIIERVINPLISAKRQYCLGEYLASIALSGIISEMLALLIWKISTFQIGGQKLSEENEEKLFGQKFENIRQERRENILITVKAIDEKVFNHFKEIRSIRNKYMHSWDYDTHQQKGDSKKTIQSAFKLYKAIADMALVVKEGNQTISINPRLLDYLKLSNPEINE